MNPSKPETCEVIKHETNMSSHEQNIESKQTCETCEVIKHETKSKWVESGVFNLTEAVKLSDLDEEDIIMVDNNRLYINGHLYPCYKLKKQYKKRHAHV